MCREGGASSFGIPKSRACAIGLSGGRLVRAGTLRLKRAEAVENAGMMGIYDVAADPGCPCERSDCGFCGGIAGEACKGFTQARIRLCPPSSLRAGQVNFGRHRYFLRLTDRKRVVEGKSVSVRVDLGGPRIINKHKKEQQRN